ncbi:MAG TPA: DUF5946 family protein [Planctomycetota bacterium]|jgi:hypothetical protein|nr:DUF5946 family protein [Planctomycetota bacterium]
MPPACSGCGSVAPEGEAGCQATFDELCVRNPGGIPSYQVRRTLVDAYALQHPDRYCASGKSFAAHLTGLCCTFEHGSHPSVLEAVQRWLNGPRKLEKPEIPSSRGGVTLADVQGARDSQVLALAVEKWARSTWEAYSALHPLARRWIQEALARR